MKQSPIFTLDPSDIWSPYHHHHLGLLTFHIACWIFYCRHFYCKVLIDCLHLSFQLTLNDLDYPWNPQLQLLLHEHSEDQSKFCPTNGEQSSSKNKKFLDIKKLEFLDTTVLYLILYSITTFDFIFNHRFLPIIFYPTPKYQDISS